MTEPRPVESGDPSQVTAAADVSDPSGLSATSAESDPAEAAGGSAAAGEQDARRKGKWPFWVELPVLIVVAFILTFLIQTFIARVYYVPSGSMEQTLHGTTSGGDRILAFKLVYDFRDPRQGEVVVFKGPDTWTPEADIPGPSTWIGKVGQALGSVVGIAPPNEKDFVKRVIAVGGQTVQCCDAKGRVEVNGVPLTEPYIYQPIDDQAWQNGTVGCKIQPEDPTHYDSPRCFGPYKVPAGEVWVMGDHRSGSADSSYQCQGLVPGPNVHCQGPIPVSDVIGKAVFIVMPPSRWGTIGSPDPMSSVAGVTVGALSTPSELPATAPAALGIAGTLGLWWGARTARTVLPGQGRRPRRRDRRSRGAR